MAVLLGALAAAVFFAAFVVLVALVARGRPLAAFLGTRAAFFGAEAAFLLVLPAVLPAAVFLAAAGAGAEGAGAPAAAKGRPRERTLRAPGPGTSLDSSPESQRTLTMRPSMARTTPVLAGWPLVCETSMRSPTSAMCYLLLQRGSILHAPDHERPRDGPAFRR